MKKSCFRIAAAITFLALPFASQAQGGAVNAPFAGGKKMTTTEALKEVPKDDPSLAPMDKALQASEGQLKKHPKDAKVKKAYVDAAYKYGHAVMTDRGKLSPKVQYRAALALYRKALAVDPKHQPSLDDKKLIEDIYKQMGMEIPK